MSGNEGVEGKESQSNRHTDTEWNVTPLLGHFRGSERLFLGVLIEVYFFYFQE